MIKQFARLPLRRGIAALLFCAVFSGLILAQDTFVAIPPEKAASYHFDYAHNFFPTPEAEKADRVNLYAALKQLEELKGKVASSAGILLRALTLNDDVQVRRNKHSTYLFLRNAVNTTDEASLTESSSLDAEVNSRTAFLQQELMQIDDRTLAALVANEPSLKSYLPAIEAVRRYSPYTLSLKEEEVLSATSPNNDWHYDLYAKLRACAPPTSLATVSDRKAREEAFKQSYAKLASQRDLYAFVLMRLASSRTRLAKLRHYPDAASEVYFQSYWTKEDVDKLIEQVAQKAGLYKRYQRLRADYVRRITGYNEVNLWDMSERPSGVRPPRFTIDEATQTIRNALAPLGPDYSRELSALLDPTNGRMDVVPGDHRRPGGFSKGATGYDSVFYSAGFAGYYNDLRVLAHESTHAVQRQLLTRNHLSPSYANGPSYIWEAFAIFSELLLPDYLYNLETDPLRKRFYLEQFLEGKGTIMFVVAPEVEVEHSVYEGVSQDAIKGPDDLDALTKRIYSRYSIWPEKLDELKSTWINIRLMYEDPFYDVNYIYGALLALKFYEMYSRDPKSFVPRYIALMSNGFTAPPDVLIKQFLDIDLHDPQLVAIALRVVEDKINLLEKSYQK